MSYVIETINLTKRFPKLKSYSELLMHPLRRKETTALENVNIQVRKGELFGLLGPNGAGKTTLIKILCTLVLPSEGSAFVNGYDVTMDGKQIRRTIGYVISEERSFFWRLTGRQNLKFFARLNNIPAKQVDQRIKEVVELTGLEDDVDNTFQDYSTGMKQKLAVARGMLTDPQILLLDEPTRSLDPISAHNLKRFIKEVIVGERKKTVIIATNNMQEAEELCGQIAIINKGKLKICESLKEIRKTFNGKDKYVLKLRGSFEYLKKKLHCQNFNGKISSLLPESSYNSGSLCRLEINTGRENISEIVEKIVSSGIKIEAFYPEEVSLNEIFARTIK
ncbi:MAG: ABC transporter ATP-binding protein [Thermodesulfobacteriota bacterium]